MTALLTVDQQALYQQWTSLLSARDYEHFYDGVGSKEAQNEAYDLLCEYLSQFDTVQAYLAQIWEKLRSRQINQVVSGYVIYILGNLQKRLACWLHDQYDNRYEARKTDTGWHIWDKTEDQSIEDLGEEEDACGMARVRAERRNGFNICIGNCRSWTPHISVALTPEQKYPRGACAVCGAQHII